MHDHACEAKTRIVVSRKLDNAELQRLTVEEYREAQKLPVVVVLDNVRSLNNVGSAFRTADALLVEAIWLCGITGTPPHNEIHRTALGAELSVPWHYASDTLTALQQLREEGYTVVAVEQVEGSVSLPSFEPQGGRRYALVFGNELHGVAQGVVDLADVCLEIPQLGTKHSFNIAVSVGIVLWDMCCKLGAVR